MRARIFAAMALILAGAPCFAVDLDLVETELKGDGAVGWIHGTVAERALFVFTYRNPQNFFDYAEMSIIPDAPGVEAALAGAHRNDRVRIKGEYADNPSPQKHILAKSIQILETQPQPAVPPYQYEASIPSDLTEQTKARFLVHAIGGDGHVLVVEFRDQIVPIYVRNARLTSGLSRNDVVDLRYKVRFEPKAPTHIQLDETKPDALTVVESIAAFNGKPADVTGRLAMFSKSPEIRFDVFAVEDVAAQGLRRQFTLVNMVDPDAFTAIRLKLAGAWRADRAVNGRNKLISTCVRVRARGVYNQVSASQANPQILLGSAADVEVLDECGSSK